MNITTDSLAKKRLAMKRTFAAYSDWTPSVSQSDPERVRDSDLEDNGDLAIAQGIYMFTEAVLALDTHRDGLADSRELRVKLSVRDFLSSGALGTHRRNSRKIIVPAQFTDHVHLGRYPGDGSEDRDGQKHPSEDFHQRCLVRRRDQCLWLIHACRTVRGRWWAGASHYTTPTEYGHVATRHGKWMAGW